jgi:hypothetical protein
MERMLMGNGDLIFRRTDSMGGNFVLTVDQASAFSHVGLIYEKAGRIFVIHASPASDLSPAQVRMDTIEKYLEHTSAAAVYRLRNDPGGKAGQAVEAALPLVGKLAFDYEFSLADSSELYCTELVWLAYQEAGIDLVDGRYDRVSLPFLQEGLVLLPSSLAGSRWLYQVLLFETNADGWKGDDFEETVLIPQEIILP